MTIKFKKIFLISFIAIVTMYIFSGFLTPLITTNYCISSSKIPKEFDGYVIVQLSDFHCNQFGDNEEELIHRIQNANPDIIVLTGDFIDANPKHNIENLELLFKGITSIAPTYYITGNNEYYLEAPFDTAKRLCKEYGVEYLKNRTVSIFNNGSSIQLSGLDDLNFKSDLKNTLGYANTDDYNILLFHRADYFDFVCNYNYDLVLSGHTHGGIVRLPFIGGLFGNEHMLFPKYDYGLFNKKGSVLISSSGLGNSSIPRFNNPYEIVRITLQSE